MVYVQIKWNIDLCEVSTYQAPEIIMKLKGLQCQIGVLFFAFLGACMFFMCVPCVEAQGPTDSTVSDLDLVSKITRFPETVRSRPIDKLRDVGEAVSEMCLKIRHGERKSDHTKCDSIRPIGFDSDISNLKFREKRFFPQPLNHSLDSLNRIPDEALDTATFRKDLTIEKFRTVNLIDSTAAIPQDQTGELVDDPTVPPDTGFRWGPAITQSLMFLGVQHGFALTTQAKTRNALADGNFFVDYYRSAKSLGGWNDHGKFFTNFIAHPMQGALTGFIYVQNAPEGIKQRFGNSRGYWKSRTYAFLWSTFWSTQFELGPVSQASIGNIGLAGKQSWVDIVITPTAGTGWLIAEDALDRYLIRHAEGNNLFLRILFRVFFNPFRSVSNLFRFKEPWYRDRPLGH